MIETFLSGFVFGGIGGAVLGYWLSSHVHSVANKAAQAVQDVANKVAPPSA